MSIDSPRILIVVALPTSRTPRPAISLAAVDAAAARALLLELGQIQPARPEAAQALEELSGISP